MSVDQTSNIIEDKAGVASYRPSIAQLVATIFSIVLVVAAVMTKGFFTTQNGKAILDSFSLVGIVAVGITLMVISGNLFSLSSGVTLTVCAMAFLTMLHFGVLPAIILTIVLGGLIFAAQGWLVGRLGANVIIITIAAGGLQAGIAEYLSGGVSVYPPKGDTSFLWLNKPYFGLAFSVWVLFGIIIITEFFLRRSLAGRQIYLLGENKAAARAAGLRVTRLTVIAFFVAGACVGVAGVLTGAFSQNINMGAQGTYTFDAIVAVLVGGTAVLGGRGSVLRTAIGALIVAAVGDLLLLRGYNPPARILVEGILLLGVVVLMQINDRGRVK